MIEAILSLSGIGIVAAFTLGLAAKKFAIEIDAQEQAIQEALPGANCGACGFPGCSGYAKAVFNDEATPTLCPPGGTDLTEELSRILGVKIQNTAPQVAMVLCQGDNNTSSIKYRYLGITDCSAAQKVAGGPKKCSAGCLGFGTCARVCPFDAIETTSDGLAVINREKCTGCRKCIDICPRNVIAMVPKSSDTHVLCNSHDKGADVRKYCEVGCIGCQVCAKISPESYEINNWLAKVRYPEANDAHAAIEKCPTKCIRDFSKGYPPGSSYLPKSTMTHSSAA